MHRLISNKGSLLWKVQSKKGLLPTNFRPFSSNKYLEDGEYIEGEFGANPDLQDKSKSSTSEFSKKFVRLDDLKKNFHPPKFNATKNEEEVSNALDRVQEKFKFQISVDVREHEPKKDVAAEVPKKPKIKAKSADSQQAIHKKMEDKLNKLKGLLKPTDDIIQKKAVIDGVMQERTQKVKEIKEKNNKFSEEYAKGEEGVDWVRIDEQEARNYPEMHFRLLRDIHDFKEQSKGRLIPEKQLSEWRQGLIRQDQENELVDFDKIKHYPGSSKGPKPDDDPEYFAEWYVNNISEEMKDYYKSLPRKELGLPEEINADNDSCELTTEHILQTNITNLEVPLLRPEDLLAQSDTNITYHSGMGEDEIPLLPDNMNPDHHENQRLIEKWLMFRMFPKLLHFFGNYHSMIDAAMSGEAAEERKLPSLFRYYNLLPEFARNHVIVKNAVRGMEYFKHQVPFEEKELMLNYICKFTLPREEWYEKALSEALITEKYFVPLWEEIALLEEGEEGDEEDTEKEVDSKKKKKDKRKKTSAPVLDPEKMKDVQKSDDITINEDWNAPVRHRDPYTPRDPQPDLPIIYYDNEDGFWDRYIAWKEKQYADFPMIQNRKYFKH